MSKHHLQSVAEQITKTGHGSAPFHNEKSCLINQVSQWSQEIFKLRAAEDE